MQSNDNTTYWWHILNVKTDKNIIVDKLKNNFAVYRESRTNDIINENYTVYYGDLELSKSSFVWEYVPSQSVILLRRKAFDKSESSINHIVRNEFISNFPVEIETKKIVPNIDDAWNFVSHITSDENNISIINSSGMIMQMSDFGLEFNYKTNYSYPIQYAYSTHKDKRKRIEYNTPNNLKLPLYGKYKENYIQLFTDTLL